MIRAASERDPGNRSFSDLSFPCMARCLNFSLGEINILRDHQIMFNMRRNGVLTAMQKSLEFQFKIIAASICCYGSNKTLKNKEILFNLVSF